MPRGLLQEIHMLPMNVLPRRSCLLGAALACLVGCGGVPQKDLKLGMRPIELWQFTRSVERYERKDLGLVLAGEAACCMPFGVRQAFVVRLAKDAMEAEVWALECDSSPEAYGVFAALRANAGVGTDVQAGAAAQLRENTVRAWKGRYVLMVKGLQNLEGEQLVGLADLILQPIEDASVMPPLVRALPERNLVAGSQLLFRYRSTLDLVWRFEDRDPLRLGTPADGPPVAEGVYALYMFDRWDVNLMVVAYKDAARAAEVEKDLVARVRKGTESYRFTGRFHEAKRPDETTALITRRGGLLMFVPSTKTSAAAKGVVNEMLLGLAPEAE
jgi:hypothetical protein